jgi:Major capsid protein N-terminus/Large eukaryotic DNA virus major capsid protein
MAQTAAVIGLNTTGPQDEYLFSEKAGTWRPNIRQHTHFTKFHRTTYPNVNQFVGQTVEFILKPKEYGDLMTNMYLGLTLPSGTYTPWVGRAIIEHVEFRIGQNVVEKITDDWYVIRDQLFLDADEKLAMAQAINGGSNENTAPASYDLMIPLEFFFCRRHSFVDPNRENIEKPPLPLCAINEFISIKFFFRPQSWFTNTATPIEFSNVRLVTEEIILTPEEKLYYKTNPQRIVIQQAFNNPTLSQTTGTFMQNLTAKFPVTMLAWCVRNKTYEGLNQAANRYSYGYTNGAGNYVTQWTQFNGVTASYSDQIQEFQMFINGRDVTGAFGTDPFFQLKQTMDANLSVPSKPIYTYSFGFWPHEYNQGGFLDFEKTDPDTTKIKIIFNPALSDISQNYSLILYYYGYQVLTIANGRSTLLYK